MNEHGYLSINLDVSGRRCLIIGGGNEAHRRAAALVELGAAVVVVSPRVVPDLLALAMEDRVDWRQRRFLVSDLDGAWAVWNTVTTDAILRQILAQEAASQGVLLTSSDHADESNFTMPAVLTRGKLRIAVSTSNACPSFSARVRDGLAEAFDAEFERYLEWVGDERKKILATASGPEERRERTLALLHGFRVTASRTLPQGWERDCLQGPRVLP